MYNTIEKGVWLSKFDQPRLSYQTWLKSGMASNSSKNAFQLPREKRQILCLQDIQRHSNPMVIYIFPFVLGLLMGCAVVLLTHLNCWSWGELWTCQEKEREVEILLQVAPAPQLYIPQDSQKGEVIRENNQQFPPSNNKKHVVSLVSGCPDRPLHLVILILSAPSSSLRRTAIRGTWAHDYRNRVVKATTKFLIGIYELDYEKVNSITQEQEMFGDILILKNLKDSYSNLSAKVLLGMQWANSNMEFDYLVKVDDDSYVRVEATSNALRKLSCDQHLYWGYFMGHAYPEPSGKWAEQKWFHCPHYLPYAMGGGYVISQRTVKMLMKFSHRLILYNNEDVTVGNWLAPYRLNRKHDLRFNVESLSHGCNNGYLITHKERVRTFYAKYTSLIRNGTLCTEEKEVRPAYVYNWTVSPLNCCKRIRGLPVT